MSVKLTKAGAQASVLDRDGRGGLSIALSQPKGSTAKWQFSVRAQTDEGLFQVGSFITSPPPLGVQLSRVVAVASLPGAIEWTCFVDLVDGDQDGAMVSLAVGCCCSNTPGVVRVSERYKHYTGSAAGAVNVEAGETVIAWSAACVAVGCSVTIDSLPAIVIPNGGSIAANPAGTIEGPVTFTFTGAGISAYLVEVALSA